MNSAKVLGKKLNSMSVKLESKIEALHAEPDVETIHDIRTTSRRIQAYADLLPKSIKKKSKVVLYLARIRALFKATTPIRDYDIIQEKLKKFETIPEIKKMLDQKKTREDLLRKANRIATVLKKTGAPKFKVGQISQSRLSKRKRKVLRKYQGLLAKQMEIEHPTIEQLHDFRKNCKMLRYILETNSKELTIGSLLVKMQGDLGVIMDVQATLERLSKLTTTEAAKMLIADLEAEKENASRDFVASKPKFVVLLTQLVPKKN